MKKEYQQISRRLICQKTALEEETLATGEKIGPICCLKFFRELFSFTNHITTKYIKGL